MKHFENIPKIEDPKKKDWLLLILGLMGGKAGLDISKDVAQWLMGIISFALLFLVLGIAFIILMITGQIH